MRVQTSGSRPAAMRIMATSSVLRCSSAGSCGMVRAWRSTTQKMASSWSSAQLRIAPRKFPRWMSPVGWMPEKTRAMGRHGMRGFPPPHRYCGLVAYEVTTAVFEGPFDLLLHLITREQVDIYEVSLSAIVDAYIAEIERMQLIYIAGATEFLLIPAILVELKTKRLLPGSDDIDLDEELALWEERDMLLTRLLECKTFKDAAAELARMAGRAERSQPRRAGLEAPFLAVVPDFLAGVTPEELRAAFLRAVMPKPVPHVEMDHVAPIRASVADAATEL